LARFSVSAMTRPAAATHAIQPPRAGPFARMARRRWGAVLLLALGVLVLRLGFAEPLASLRNAYFDLQQRLFPRGPFTSPVVIVDIDERSLAAIGQWPWPRNVLADLVARVAAQRPSAIGLVMILSEPDRLSPENLRRLPALEAARLALADLPSHDRMLADAIGLAPTVLAAAATSAEAAEAPPPPGAMVFKVEGRMELTESRFPGMLRNLESLERASGRVGVVSYAPTQDGLVRRLPALVQVKETVFPAFAVELVRAAEAAAELTVEGGPDGGVARLWIGRKPVDTDASGNVWLRFAPAGSAPRMSAVDVLSGKAELGRLRGQAVLIGAGAAGVGSSFAVPTGARLSALDLQAQFVGNLSSGDYLRRPPAALAWETIAAVAAGLLVLGVARTFVRYRSQGPVLLAAAAVAAASLYAFSAHSLLLDATFVLVVMAGVYLAVVVRGMVEAQKARQRSERDREHAIIFAEASNRSRANFLAHMSHELRTPLTAILGYSEVMKSGTLGPISPPRYREYAEDIHRTGSHLLGMVEQILGMTEAEAGELRLAESDFPVAEAVRACLGRIDVEARVKGADIALVRPEAWPRLRADRMIFMQMVLNLLSNALKFTPAQGAIRIGCVVSARGVMRLTVADDGAGMNAAEVAGAFKPFRRGEPKVATPQGGIGLGLPLTKIMIELHGGRIALRSAPGRGVAATLFFPARRVRASALSEGEGHARARTG